MEPGHSAKPRKPARKPVVYAFIDSQNLNLGIRSLGWHLDFARFRVYLAEKYNVEKAYVFIGYTDDNNDLYESLQEAGYIIVFKPTLTDREGNTKGNVDAELVLHAMIHFPTYTQAIIVSGDGDFFCLAEYLEKKGKLAKVLVPNQHRYSALLKRLDSGYLAFVSDQKRKLAYKRKEPRTDQPVEGAFRGDYPNHTKNGGKRQSE